MLERVRAKTDCDGSRKKKLPRLKSKSPVMTLALVMSHGGHGRFYLCTVQSGNRTRTTIHDLMVAACGRLAIEFKVLFEQHRILARLLHGDHLQGWSVGRLVSVELTDRTCALLWRGRL